MECPICCDTFTKQSRKEIKCPSIECQKSCCTMCFKKYLIDGEDITPKCMFCSKDISYSFIRDILPRSWVNKDYLHVRTKHLLSREQSLLPQQQHQVAIEIDKRKRREQQRRLSREIDELREKMLELDNIRYDLNFSKLDASNKKIVTLRRCLENDCKGFLNDDWLCGLCNAKVCIECGDKCEEKHICDKNQKKSFKTIEASSRPCPKCAIPIHKWQGCNQMYCTQCGCMFDYRSGRLETGVFHNPHYFEAIRLGNITQRENNQCNDYNVREFIRFSYKLHQHLSRINHSERLKFRSIQNLPGLVNHIDRESLTALTPAIFDNECSKMRTQYLMNEISLEDWTKHLKRIEKKREKNKEVYILLELFRDVGNDILSNIYTIYKRDPTKLTYNNTHEDILQHINEMINITKFINDKFVILSKQFSLTFPIISDDWLTYECKGL